MSRAPGYVQALGYAAFGLMATFSLAGVSWILGWPKSTARSDRLAGLIELA